MGNTPIDLQIRVTLRDGQVRHGQMAQILETLGLESPFSDKEVMAGLLAEHLRSWYPQVSEVEIVIEV